MAICQPRVRKIANPGDFLVGIAGNNLGKGRLIYAAKITEILYKGQYYRPANFNRNDCVYEQDPNNGNNPRHRGPAFSHSADSFLVDDVGHAWENANVLKSTDFRYYGGNGICLDYFVKYQNLRSLLELDRCNFPNVQLFACLPITVGRIEWEQLNEVLRNLWATPNVPGNKSTQYHPAVGHGVGVQGKWPRKKLSNQETKDINAKRKANPVSRVP